MSSRFSAKDPAIPTFEAPAPEVALVAKLLPLPVDSAATVALPVLTALAIVASFTTLAMLMPSATPTPVADSTVEPSEVRVTAFSDPVSTLSAPVTVVVAEELIRALVVEVRSEIASAPATETPPPLVWA